MRLVITTLRSRVVIIYIRSGLLERKPERQRKLT